MRKATLCFLLMLCSVLLFGQDEPQWKVVKHVVLFNQNQNLFRTTLLTPTEPGVYRLSLYFSGVGTNNGNNLPAELDVIGTELAGSPVYAALPSQCTSKSGDWASVPPITVILKPQVPLQYQVRFGLPSCFWNLAITVEQLM